MKILFQGDSITDGNRYKDIESRWDKNHQIGHSFAYIVTGLISMQYPKRQFEFVNRGVSGNRTNELLSRWNEDTIEENPDVLIMLVGVNDAFCNYEGREYDEKAELYEKNYRELLKMAKDKNPELKVIMLEPFANVEIANPSENISREFRQEKLNNIQAKVRKIAKDFGAIFIPLQDKFNKIMDTPYPKYWLWDGVHPTEAGHAALARDVIYELNKILNIRVEI
ncbi:MAG: SGNH/GDSL hydrolase family protein [Clostridia bacterium]|nr:SGNH/GDSL hydrolase family protein [Clostridia bacterium]